MVEQNFADSLVAALRQEAEDGRCFLAMAALYGEPLWVIVDVSNNDDCLFWSNEHGFVESGFDIFSDQERRAVDLPMGGQWIDVPAAIDRMKKVNDIEQAPGL